MSGDGGSEVSVLQAGGIHTVLASVQDSWSEITRYWHQFKTPGLNKHGIGTSSRLLV